MGQTADQIRQAIAGKRDDAAAKIDEIEARVQDLPNLAKETVRGTVDASLQQARASVEETVGQMKQQMDLRAQIEQRPLAALGIAFAGGYLLGKLIGDGGAEDGAGGRDRYRTDWSQAHSMGGQQHAGEQGGGAGMSVAAGAAGGYAAAPGQARGQGGLMAVLRRAAHDAGLDDTLSALSGALVATLTDQFHRTIRETFPDFAQHLEQQGGLGSRSGSGSGRSSGTGSSVGSSMSGMGGGSSTSGSSGGAAGGFGSSGGIGGAGGGIGAAGGSGQGSGTAYGQGEAQSAGMARSFGSGAGAAGWSDAAGGMAGDSGAGSGAGGAMGGVGGSGATTDASARSTPYYGGDAPSTSTQP